jgi:hypothetical protein
MESKDYTYVTKLDILYHHLETSAIIPTGG